MKKVVNIDVNWVFLLLLSAFWVVTDQNCWAQGIQEQPVAPIKAQVSAAPQFMILAIGEDRIQSYGVEFGAWYRLRQRTDVGVSVLNFYSILQGGTNILSTLIVKVRYGLIGGDLPKSVQWTLANQVFATTEERPTRSLSLVANLEQATFNADGSSSPYAGFGLGLCLSQPLSMHQRVNVGASFDRLSNGQRILVPLRAELGWSVDLD